MIDTMNLKTLPIHKLKLSNELKTAGYKKANSSLIEEIREFGFLSPVVACPVPQSDQFEILAQEESWFGAQQLGIHDIPVNVVNAKNNLTKLKYVNIDNPENPIAKAERFEQWLCFEKGRKKQDLAGLENCTPSNISHQLRLLTLEPSIQDLLTNFQISAGHGKELLKHPAGQGRVDAAEQAARKKWPVSRLKTHLAQHSQSIKNEIDESTESQKDANTIRLEKDLTGLVGSSVTIDLENGELKIDYNKNYEILDGIIEKLGYRA